MTRQAVVAVGLALLGGALILVGLWLIWTPLVFIAAGLALIAFAFFMEV